MIDIILLEPEHEGNVGAVCRVMANFNFQNLVVVNPKCNLEGDELFRRAKHSKKIVKSIKVLKKIPKYHTLIGTTSKLSSDYNVLRTPITPEQLAKKLSRLKKQKIGIMFGREGIGLTNQEIMKCDLLLSINSAKSYSSLNLSHAVAIVLYELHRSSGDKLLDNIEPAGKAEIDQINKMSNRIIRKAFKSKERATIQKQIWKNVFRRATLSKREAFGVMGLLNKILKKL